MKLLAAFVAVSSMALASENAAANRMVYAAKNFVASLDDSQKQKAMFPFEGDERFFWQYIPSEDIQKRFNRPRRGLPLREMTQPQRHLASALLAAGLSQKGYIKATTIMSLEDVLRMMEKDSGERRNPEKYFFSIFGEPSDGGTWGYRVEGHHVSVHFTVAGGRVIGNPTFFGANPAEVRVGPRTGLRALAAEEDRARALLESLTPDQRKTAIVTDKAYADILTEASRKAALQGQPSGLSASKLNGTQKKLLQELLSEYAENLPEEMAAQRREKIRQAGNNLFFAWAGVPEKGGPHYYRVQAQAFLIEYDNTQNGANHIHSVWRDFNGDWGEDLLAQHYQQTPHGTK
jgi:hypothetical protein